jgi:hypothetical protein
LLSLAVGLTLLAVLFTYCRPDSIDSSATNRLQFWLFSAVCGLSIVLAIGVFLNYGYPIGETDVSRNIFGGGDFGKHTGLYWGDLFAFIIWIVSTVGLYLSRVKWTKWLNKIFPGKIQATSTYSKTTEQQTDAE